MEQISGDLGFNVWLKREDLNHTELKLRAIGQVLLAKKMGKKNNC